MGGGFLSGGGASGAASGSLVGLGIGGGGARPADWESFAESIMTEVRFS